MTTQFTVAKPSPPVGPSNTEEKPKETKAEQVDEVLQALLGKITPLTAPPEYLKVLVYGDPDAGKSTFGGSADNNLIIDADKGLVSLTNNPQLIGKNSQRYPYNTFQGFEVLLDYLHKQNAAFDWTKVVTIDTLSELHKKGLAEITERDHAMNPYQNNKYMAQTEQHTENNEHIRRIVSSLKDLNRDLIILAHSRIIEPKNAPSKVYPDFSEKLAKSIVALVDICVYIEKREVDGEIKRVFRFHTPDTIMTKCRIGGLPSEAVDITWPKLRAAFEKHTAKEKEEKAK